MSDIEKNFKRSCREKKRYSNKEEALLAARSHMISDPKCPDLDIYKCSYCPGWHLTSNT